MLYDAVKQSLARGAQIFVFVPAIDAVQRVVDIFRDVFGSVEIEGTSSKDAMREEKVRRYRAASVQIIVTTTILERGVTIPRADVFVLEADSPLFHEAALIQMAGRAGRNEADPHGFVYFCASDWTTSQQKAVQHIQSMNQLAKKKGYLAS
jgi:competence protein ComFA